MKSTGTISRKKFDVLLNTRDAQAAMMTLRPGESSDASPSNEHRHSEQWMYVLSGTATVRIGKRRTSLRSIKLRKNSLLVIEKGELHQIANSGRRPLVTLSFYIPPAYEKDGEPRP